MENSLNDHERSVISSYSFNFLALFRSRRESRSVLQSQMLIIKIIRQNKYVRVTKQLAPRWTITQSRNAVAYSQAQFGFSCTCLYIHARLYVSFAPHSSSRCVLFPPLHPAVQTRSTGSRATFLSQGCLVVAFESRRIDSEKIDDRRAATACDNRSEDLIGSLAFWEIDLSTRKALFVRLITSWGVSCDC